MIFLSYIYIYIYFSLNEKVIAYKCTIYVSLCREGASLLLFFALNQLVKFNKTTARYKSFLLAALLFSTPRLWTHSSRRPCQSKRKIIPEKMGECLLLKWWTTTTRHRFEIVLNIDLPGWMSPPAIVKIGRTNKMDVVTSQ